MKDINIRIQFSVLMIALILAVVMGCASQQSQIKADGPAERSELADKIKPMPPDEQLTFLENLRVKDGDRADIHFLMGNALYTKGNLDSAIVHYNRAVDIDSTHSKAYTNMGIALDTKGVYAGARAAYQKAISINPADVLAYCHLGYNYFSKGEQERAMTYYEKALLIDPNSAQAHYNVGLAFADAKIFNEAITEWEIVIKLDPEGQLGKIAKENVELIKTYLSLDE